MKILFYYSIIVTSILLIASFFFVPKFQNIIITASLIPVVVYFWIASTNPKETNFPQWSIRFLLSVAVLSALGILAYSRVKPFSLATDSKNNELSGSVQSMDELKDAIDSLRTSDKNTSNEALLAALDNIREELINIKAEQRGITKILGITSSASEVSQLINSLSSGSASESASNTPDAIGFVTPISSSKSTYAYSEPKLSSEKLSKLNYNQKYPFFKKQGTWYQILLPDDTEGWASSEDVKEQK